MAVAEQAAAGLTAAAASHRGRAFGLDVRSTFDIPALSGGAGSSARLTVCHEQDAVDLERDWPRTGVEHPVDLRFPDGRLFMSIDRHPERGYRIWAPRHGRHVVSPDGREIRSALPRRSALGWQRLFFAQTLPLAAALQGLEVLHASAVGIGGRAVAFTAASGTGKSSLAAHLVAAGATFLTDDVLALEPGPDGALAHPGPARAGVSAHELRSMTAVGRDRLGRRVGSTDKPHFEPSQASSALPLAILFRLSRSSRFARLSLREQLPPEPKTVLGSSFLTYLRTRQRLLNQLAICERVTGSARLYDLEIPASVSAREAASFVLEHAKKVLGA
ncbi:MAG: hypothetical protein MSC30_05135 [Gaiellaceae bacterium MAG52_C11]|nr:hypothetical protein [Candidatus Gaiellasilicea maunaloa]